MLGLLDIFRKKKKEKEKADVESTQVMTELEKLCGNDRETYEALLNTMFLDPRKIEVSMKEAVKSAKKFEKAKDSLRAKLWYEIAGGLAIYEGNVKKVTEFFSKCEKISPGTKYLILKNPETAIVKAQEYYQKHLKA
ncbi:MAG: hypothetical protein QMD23_04305 [Candidatus Bathyarchaeia archaeon]|nr:hypothetical protein [Candidatus Bathyarchaeia archaeon]